MLLTNQPRCSCRPPPRADETDLPFAIALFFDLGETHDKVGLSWIFVSEEGLEIVLPIVDRGDIHCLLLLPLVPVPVGQLTTQ